MAGDYRGADRLRCGWCGGPDTLHRPCVVYADGWAHADRCYAQALAYGLDMVNAAYGDSPPEPAPRPDASPAFQGDAYREGTAAIERLLTREDEMRRRRLIERAARV